MQEGQTDLLNESVLQLNTKKRYQLIPWWIKIFIWIFLFFGAIIPIGLIFGILGYNFQLSLYGLVTNEPLSLTGICIIILFLFKGITALGLLKEKNWAIKLGIVDSITGIAVCVLIMLYPLINAKSGIMFSFKIEILFLIPYLLKMINIKSAWENTIQI